MCGIRFLAAYNVFLVTKMGNKDKKEEVVFSGPPTYQELCDKVETVFKHFAKEAYKLVHEQHNIIDQKDWSLAEPSLPKPPTIVVCASVDGKQLNPMDFKSLLDGD